jgi:exopolyphosphatase/guanosine-5'-triphosphate,3'-diphosphate pyrophosphatase
MDIPPPRLTITPMPYRPRRKISSARTGLPRTPHGLRIAAIDIGTNSLHMVVVEVTEHLGFKTLCSEKDLTQLGSDALVRHELSRRAMLNTQEVLARYQSIARGQDVDVTLAYATSAVRECANGSAFVHQIKSALGLQIQVISAPEEARLIYLAVRQAVDIRDEPVLIVDIGGGSTELIVGTADEALLLESHKLGAARLTQMFVAHDPIRKGELKQLEKHIKKTLAPTLDRIRELGPTRVLGTSGTMENLVSLCLLQHGADNIRHRLLTHMLAGEFDAIYPQLVELPVAQRRKLPGLDPGRAPQIVAGATLVRHLFKELAIDQIEVCDRALREGMIIDYMQRHWPKIALSVEVRDPRRRSVIELARRCNYDQAHAVQVTRLALDLFDALAGLHKLGPDARAWLEHAATLHDIGWHIGLSGHHKHSYYLIKNGDLEGFSPLELEIIANVARYHRKSPPKKSHPDFMSLGVPERKIVTILAALLRIADGLDRGHYGNVQTLRVVRRRTGLNIILRTKTDAELELWGARNKTDLFTEVFGLPVNLSARLTKK